MNQPVTMRHFPRVLLLMMVALLASGCGGHSSSTAAVSTITITATDAITAGQTEQLHAVETNTSGTKTDITGTVTWKSSVATVATVNATGLVTALTAGTTAVTATAGTTVGTLSLTIGAPVLSKLTITPASPQVFVGQQQQFQATATYGNGTTSDLSGSVTWAVTPAAVATITSAGVLQAVSTGSFTVTATSGAVVASVSGTVGNPALTSIAISPATASIPSAGSQQFTATGHYNSGTTQDLTSIVTWTTSNPAVLTISATGLATAGSVTATTAVSVTATSASLTSSAAVNVTPTATLVSMVVTPTSSSIAPGTAAQQRAVATYSDGTQKDVTNLVTWSASETTANHAVKGKRVAPRAVAAPVAVNANGVAYANQVGAADLTATLGSIQAQSIMLVRNATVTSISVSSGDTQVPVGAVQQLALTGQFNDGSTQDLSLTANWQSSNPAIAAINGSGLMTALAPGNVTFAASFAGLNAQSGNISIPDADLVSLTIPVQNPVIFVGGVQQLSVVGIYSNGVTQDLTPLASWTSTNTAIHQVSSTGFLQTVGTGRGQVTATVAGLTGFAAIEGVQTSVTALQVLPTNDNFALGTSLQFTALGFLTNGAEFDASDVVLWTSQDPNVVTIDTHGLAKSGRIGSTTVSASLGGVTQFSAVAHVTNASVTDITVTPTSASIAVGTHQPFNVWAWFTDGSVEDVSGTALWSVSDRGILSANKNSTIFGIAPGTATATATFGSFTATAAITVTNATLVSTTISPGNLSLPVGVERQFALLGTFSDGSTQDLTANAIWLSPTPSVCFSTQTGASVGLSPGVGEIGAQYGNFSSSTQLSITDASLTGLTLTPASTTIRDRGQQQLTATGTFSDGTQQSLYLNAVFNPLDPSLIYIRAQGLAIATGVGSTQVTATFRGQSAATNFTIYSDDLQSIALTPQNPSVSTGNLLQFGAVGTYADASTQDLSQQVTWTSSNPALLSVDVNGLATAHAASMPVTVTVTAQFGMITHSFTVTISPANPAATTITALSVLPTEANIGAGTTRQFIAMATYADGSSGIVSGAATWTSSAPAVASVDDSGLSTGLNLGTSIITATANGIAASATIRVDDSAAPTATLLSIALTPSTAATNVGATQLFVATGTYNDGTIEDLSSIATWSSSGSSVATVNSAGIATGVSAGTATIRAVWKDVTGSASLITNPVVPPGTTVSSIAVTPVTASIAIGRTQQYQALATLSDGTTQDVSTAATWASVSPTVATISPAGLATGVVSGNTAIAATWNKITGITALTVTLPPGGAGNPALTAITVAPSTASIATGATAQYTATAGYADGSVGNITTAVTWTSSSAAAASISSGGLATGVATGSTTITATSGTITGNAALAVTASNATLVSIVVKPTSAQIISGLSEQFAAIGTYSDGTVRDVSSSVNWSSANSVVATVNASGLVTGVSPGSDVITAAAGSTHSQTTVFVDAATLQTIAVSPSGGSFAAGATQQFKLTGTFSNGSQVDLTYSATWASQAMGVATVSSAGLVTGVAQGTAQISAAYAMQAASTTVAITTASLVSIAVAPATASFARGTTLQFAITGTYSDGSTHDVTEQAAFLSSSNGVLTVASGGLATGNGAGTATVTVGADGDSVSTQTITVTPATLVSIAITPANPSFAKGTTQKFTATGTFSDGTTQDLSNQVVWISSDPQTATIDDSGLATSDAPGSTQLFVNFQGVTANTGTVTVSNATLTGLAISPAGAQIAEGTMQQFTATGTYSDGSTQNLSTLATWSSSNATVASVSATGLATGNGVGAAQITATFGGSTVSTSSFQVTQAVLVSLSFSPASPSVAVGSSLQETVTGTFSDSSTQDLTSSSSFHSSNPSAVTVSSSGVITGVAAGNSTITVTVDGQTDTLSAVTSAATLSSIAITPASPAGMPKGTMQQFTATGTYSDGATQNLSSTVTWTSSNTGVLTVDTQGLATGTGVGTATLNATYQGETATSAPIAVSAAAVASLAITPVDDSVVTASTLQYTAIATFTDATTQNVTSSAAWSSSSASVAAITPSTGLATAATAGSTTIAAVYSSITRSTTLTVTAVTNPTLNTITVAPSNPSVARGNTQQFTATGNYSDGSTQNLTSQATWQSSAPATATVNTTGLATGVAGGNAAISATDTGISGVSNLTVSAGTLVSLSVTPASVSLARGTTQQYTATGTLSDGSTQDYTNSVTWTSTSTSVATINSSGLATTVSTGSTTIRAQAGSVSNTAAMTVTAATVVSLSVTPPTVTYPAGGMQQLAVTAVFTDGSMQNVTNGVTYVSANAGVVTVNATGLLTLTGAGTTTVTVSLASTTSTVNVVGTSASLSSIAVTPANPSLVVGSSQQMTATGTFSDGSTQNETSTVTWTSSAPALVSVSTAGVVTVNAAGNATITATSGTTSGTTVVTGTTATVTSITVIPASATLAVGQSQQFTATGSLNNGTQQGVTTSVQWSTSDATKATISNTAGTNGLLITTGSGTVIVTATMNSVAGSASVTISSALLTSLTVSPSPASVSAGGSQQLTVTGNYTDGSTANVTSTATWTTASATIATVDASGVLHGASPGSTTVTATVNAIQKADAVTVTNAVLQSISINPQLPTTPLGVSVQLTATGHYSDGSTENLTSLVGWGSSSPSVATVSASGLANTVSAGSTNITATLGSSTQLVPLTVTSAALQSISVQALQTSFAKGLTLQLIAIGTYSDGSTQNLSGVVSWSSATPSIGVVNSSGVASGVTPGTFNAVASLSGVTGSLALTVTSAVLQSIAVTPANQLLLNVLGHPVQFTATGTFSDGSTQNITTSCHWTVTSGVAIGSISQTGSFTGLAIGIGTVTATDGTVTGSTGITVVSL